MNALAEAYDQDEAERGEILQVMIDRQAARQHVYPINRREARTIAKVLTREIDEQEQAATTEADAHVAAWRRHHGARLCEFHRIDYPESKYGRHCEVARLKDVSWWGRKLRVSDWRQFEERQLNLGEIKHFVSNDIARARTWHREALAALLASLYAMRDDGSAIMTLADLAASSTSNPANRRAEMIVRAKGLARWRASQGFTWTFATLTAPSKYHRMRTRDDQLEKNPKWDAAGGFNPRETQEYLNGVWEKFRAQLDRAGIKWSAFRTVEPHADGTPHWHICIMTRPEDRPRVKLALWNHAMKEDRAEDGAVEHRCTFKDYDPANGEIVDMADRCVAYLIAYVSKNIDGMRTVKGDAQVAADSFDVTEGKRIELGHAVESARRVEAWATLWGIRQFQELGGAPVTAYRELRRIREPLANQTVEPARAAADAGDYHAFIVEAKAAQLELWSETSEERILTAAADAGLPVDEATPELAELVIERQLLTKWGEPLRRWVLGVKAPRMGWLPCVPHRVQTGEEETVLTRRHTWAVMDSSQIEAAALAEISAAYFAAASELCRTDLSKYDERAATERALALAPGFFFSRAAPPRALDLCH